MTWGTGTSGFVNNKLILILLSMLYSSAALDDDFEVNLESLKDYEDEKNLETFKNLHLSIMTLMYTNYFSTLIS